MKIDQNFVTKTLTAMAHRYIDHAAKQQGDGAVLAAQEIAAFKPGTNIQAIVAKAQDLAAKRDGSVTTANVKRYVDDFISAYGALDRNRDGRLPFEERWNPFPGAASLPARLEGTVHNEHALNALEVMDYLAMMMGATPEQNRKLWTAEDAFY